MMIFRMLIVGGTKWTFPFGASAMVEEQPWGTPPADAPDYFPRDCYPTAERLNGIFVAKGVGLGERVATVAMQLLKYRGAYAA